MKHRKYFRVKTKLFSIIIIAVIILLCPGIINGEEDQNNSRVVVFVLDTGFTDQSLKQQLSGPGEVGHGPIVAHIIREEAPETQIITHSVTGENGQIKIGKYLAGLERIYEYKREHTDHRVLVNISLAISEYDVVHHRLIKKLYNSGVTIIAAAGNDDSGAPVYPAAFSGAVVAVGDATREGKTPYSNYGDHLNISASGQVELVVNQYLPGNPGIKKVKTGGTSFAAPRITGILAQILCLKPGLTTSDALEIIYKTADPVDDEKFETGLLGAGVLNKGQALSLVDQRNWWQRHKKRLVPAGILLFIMLIFIYREGLVGFFLFMLALLIVFPVLIPAFLYLHANITDFSQLGRILLIGLPGLCSLLGSLWILHRKTGWQIPNLLIKQLLLFLGLMVGLLYIRPNPWQSIIGFLSGFSLLTVFLIFREHQLKQHLLASAKPELMAGYIEHPNLHISKIALSRIIEEEGIGRLLTSNPKSSRTRTLIVNQISEKLLSSQIPITERKQLLIELFKSLTKPTRVNPGLIQPLMKKLPEKTGLRILGNMLYSPEYDRRLVLKLIAGFGKRASGLSPEIHQLLKQEQNTWVRYQALRTLTEIQPDRTQLKKTLTSLLDDQQELVRLEARGLLNELENIINHREG